MGMQFFNFGSQETFHFFKWVTESGCLKTDELIAKAMQQVEGDEMFEMGVSVSDVARDKLAELLEEALDDVKMDALDDIEGPEIGCVWNDPASLWKPLLTLAFYQIDCRAVAEALLIRAGKWAPDKELPEAI